MVLSVYNSEILAQTLLNRVRRSHTYGHLVGDDIFQQTTSFVSICHFSQQFTQILQLLCHRGRFHKRPKVNHILFNYFCFFKLVSCLIIGYLCCCAYYAVFKLRIFNYYYVSSNHQTSENSLIFSGT